MSAFTDEVVRLARAELARWNEGLGKETKDPYCGYVGEYWKVGLENRHIDGRTTYQSKNGKLFRPAWSSAFISYLYRRAGAARDFHYSDAHIHYVSKAIEAAAAGKGKFLARDPSVYAPKPGDLINEGRDWAKALAYPEAVKKCHAKPGQFIPTHSDVVVKVDTRRGQLTTIGGNVATDTVGEKIWHLRPDGTLEKGDKLICVIECLL